MKILTYSKQAWITSPSGLDAIMRGDVPSIELHDSDMAEYGWIMIGAATVTVHVKDDDKIIDDAVHQINKAILKTKADTEVKIMKLQEMTNNLLALTYTPVNERRELEASPLKPFLNKTADFDDDIPF